MTTSHMIMVSGKQGSGKSTLCDSLEKLLPAWGYQIVRTRFASPIYEMHDAALEIARRYGIETKGKDGSLLQLIGTEWGRKTIHEDVWVNCLKVNFAHYQNLFFRVPLVVLVEDLRFVNEFEGFPDAIRIRLRCSKDVRRERTHSWRENDTHPSEIDLDDHELLNKFDMLLDTSALSQQNTLSAVMDHLQARGLCSDTRGLKIAE